MLFSKDMYFEGKKTSYETMSDDEVCAPGVYVDWMIRPVDDKNENRGVNDTFSFIADVARKPASRMWGRSRAAR